MRHGTNACYVAGCREQPCKDAHATYRRGLRAKRYLKRADRLHIDATGTQRRIQALLALGWRYRDINARAGWRVTHSGGNAHNILRQEKVHVDTAAIVRRVYDEMSMTLPTHKYVNRQRLIAAAKGWPVPMAWDEGAIDNPNARPIVAREPGRQGVSAGQLGSVELVAEWDHLRSLGESMHSAAKQLGVTVAAIEKAVERVGKKAA